MSDDSEPFFSSSKVDSVSDQYPDLKSLDVRIEMTDPVGDRVGFKAYDEDDMPSRVQCAECGHNVPIGHLVGNYIDDKKTDFKEKKSCTGQIHENKTCVVTFEIEGKADYV
jgi:hypothetical protein